MDSVHFEDHSTEVLDEFDTAILRALEKCGLMAEGYAEKLVPVNLGNLRNSISHVVDPDEPAVYVGTDSEYGPYVELGTGKYYPGGRQDPWVYQDAKGQWHLTHGQRAQPYLKPAVADHQKTYTNIIEDEMRDG